MTRTLRWLVVACAALLCAPLLVVVLSPLHTPAPQWDYVSGAFLWQHLGGSMALMLGTVLLALVIGIGAAWCVATMDFPGRKVFSWAFVLPLALPTYINALAYAGLFGPTGSCSVALRDHFGTGTDIMTLPGLCVVFALVLYPYVYLPARAAFSGGLASSLEAARTLGARPWRRFVEVALPLARPAIVGGALLVCMESLNDYSAVKYYGVDTITTGIFKSWGGLYDKGSAMRLALVLLILVATLMTTERMLRRRGLRNTDGHGPGRSKATGAQQMLVVLGCSILLLTSTVMPLGALLSDAFASADHGSLSELLTAAWNTVRVGAWAALFVIIAALGMAWLERTYRGKARSLLWLARTGYVVPGAVIAVGTMALAGSIDKQWTAMGIPLQFALIGTLPLLVYAFGVRFVSVASQPLHAGLLQQSARLDEAARSLGASPLRTFFAVNLPLLRPSLIAAVLLTMLEVMKELPLTLIMRPFDFATLSTMVHECTRIEQPREAALPALLIVLCALPPLLFMDRLQHRAHR